MAYRSKSIIMYARMATIDLHPSLTESLRSVREKRKNMHYLQQKRPPYHTCTQSNNFSNLLKVIYIIEIWVWKQIGVTDIEFGTTGLKKCCDIPQIRMLHRTIEYIGSLNNACTQYVMLPHHMPKYSAHHYGHTHPINYAIATSHVNNLSPSLMTTIFIPLIVHSVVN